MTKINRITQSVLVGLITLFLAMSWTGLKNLLWHQGGWVWPTIGLFLVLFFLSLNWILSNSKVLILVTLFFLLISFFLVFGFTKEYIVVLLVSLLLFFYASYKAVYEKKARIKIEITKILRRSLPTALTGLALIIAAVYFFSPLAIKDEGQIEVPRYLFDAIIEPILTTIEGQLIEESEGQVGMIYQIAQEMGISIKKNLSLKENLQQNKELREALYMTINEEVNKYTKTYKDYFPIGLAVGVFFAVRTLAIPVMWLVILLGWGTFKILVGLGAIKIEEKAVLKEIINL